MEKGNKEPDMKRNCWSARMALVIVAVLCVESAVTAKSFARRVMNQPVGAAGAVNLPYMAPDGQGGMWRLYQNGYLQQQGNVQLYSQGATLMVNGNQPQQANNQARVDEKTGEVIFENLMGPNLVITRRILFPKDGAGFVRYIDVIKNTHAQDQTVNIQVQSHLNYGMNAVQMIPDPRRKDQNMAWVAMTGPNQTMAVAEMYSGRGAKTAFTLQWPQGNSYV